MEKKGFSVAEALVSLLVFSVILGMCAPLFSKRIDSGALDNIAAGVPSGVILMWSGEIANIPSGFVLCDGTNDTPDLSGKFIVGYSSTNTNYSSIGNNGGEERSTLSIDNLPSHSHFLAHNTRGNETTEGPTSTQFINYLGGPRGGYAQYVLNGTTNEANIGLAGYTGNGTSFENRPPYYTLAYIMKR